MIKKIAIIGVGGHAKVVGEIAMLNEFQIIDFYDDQAIYIKSFPFNIVGDLNNLEKNFNNYDNFFVAVGNNKIRGDIIKWLEEQKKIS